MIKKFKTPDEHIQDRNDAIKLPKTLTTDDGREIKIMVWAPVVAIDDLDRVTIEGVICLPKKDDQ